MVLSDLGLHAARHRQPVGRYQLQGTPGGLIGRLGCTGRNHNLIVDDCRQTGLECPLARVAKVSGSLPALRDLCCRLVACRSLLLSHCRSSRHTLLPRHHAPSSTRASASRLARTHGRFRANLRHNMFCHHREKETRRAAVSAAPHMAAHRARHAPACMRRSVGAAGRTTPPCKGKGSLTALR